MTDQRIKTLDNAIKLLDILVEHQSLGVSEIARQAHLSKTTVFRLLKALEVHHLVLQIDQENYALGYGMLKYQPLEANSQQIISLAKPYMKNFTEVTGETINLAIHYDNYVYFIHTEVGESYLLQFSLAPTAKLYCSSMGKIFLSQMADSDLKSYFQEDLVARTHHTITSYQAFKEEKSHSKEWRRI
ncbi:helix-turn-helix domain-containing protein [Streptococcus didelphis]|uniref:Helix-turn-helix domain-containing protein n=1 Tax=Streptococcus didelphis TaxID=102886 RepID=A0ABY9LGS5_9STRE|nr:helix-turn-helix domain-containing protein [Streptococcus didelphis]WMB28030.1 helix-turn-helix domain-containing protein [Streptococcus didelphis]WMB29936.1 helix-turn-helix domain-containing protein [Streptococcus didelphis]